MSTSSDECVVGRGLHHSLQMHPDGQRKSHRHLPALQLAGRPAGHFGKNGSDDRFEARVGRFDDFPVAAVAERVHLKLNNNAALRTIAGWRPPSVLSKESQQSPIPSGKTGRQMRIDRDILVCLWSRHIAPRYNRLFSCGWRWQHGFLSKKRGGKEPAKRGSKQSAHGRFCFFWMARCADPQVLACCQ